MELTKEHFDQTIKNLATQESVNNIATDVANVQKTLITHSTALDTLLTERKTKLENKDVAASRLEALERFAIAASKKLNIEFKP